MSTEVSWIGQSYAGVLDTERQMMDEMAIAIEKGRP